MASSFEKREIKKKSDNLSDWYTDVVLKAEIAEYGPARGTMVIRPYGFGIWKRVQEELGRMIKEGEVEDAYFPLFIPYSLLAKEKDHVEGFSPELALVTKAGGEDLEDPLAIRPTSETIMYEMYSKWIHSWRDLPLKINQWNNAVRWEKRTQLFIRTSEFLWQEGHCAHETNEENREMVLMALGWYKKMYEVYYAIPVVSGIKSESEKFAGADATFCVESIMPDGKALQAATSHDLGQNFSKAQNISFQDKDGKNQYAWQNSWGFSTRSLAALFMVHGDDDGFIIPPKIAPVQIVIVPIAKSMEKSVINYANELADKLQKNGLRVKMDDKEGSTPGRKFNDWEVKGVPIRLEIGPKEQEQETVTVFRRDIKEKFEINKASLIGETERNLDEIQSSLYEKAKTNLNKNTHQVNNYDEFKEIMKTKRGFIYAFWCEDSECEAKVKEETKATTRCRPLDAKAENGECIACGKDAKYRWYFAQAY